MASPLASPAYQQLLASLVGAREQARLTQGELARRLNRPQSFVSKYENGERRLDVIQFVAVCRALGIKPSAVIQQFDEPDTPLPDTLWTPSPL